tara:strand:+ start:11095 stop:12741 length:1647 start_codon:yes stop_codon:yes gene_type:complete
MEIKELLTNAIEGTVACDDKTRTAYSEDTSIFHIKPSCVVYPKHTEDIKALVRLANKHPGEFSLTARAAGTDMSGGPLSDSVVVSFVEHFNKIKTVNDGFAVTEPGVFYRDFEEATLEKNLLLPCYTASRELNTVGGMVANNSAGEKSLTYGKTERYVKALRVVLSDGNEYEFRKLTRDELEVKKSLDTFEGKIYRELEQLVVENDKVLQEAKPPVSKNSAGYALWDVWDKEADTFDLTKLFVGSQGTLGLMTEITFDLVPPTKHARMLVIFLRRKHMPLLGSLVNDVLSHNPESFESYDDHTFTVMLKVLPKLMKRLGRNPFSLFRDFVPEIKMVLTGGIPKLILMAEFTGNDEAEVIHKTESTLLAIQSKYSVSLHSTRTQAERDKFWAIRRESFKLLREQVHGKHTAPFIDDISVNPKFLPEFLPKLYDIMDEYRLTYTIAGHIGDGNFHIIPLMDFERPDFVEVIEELSKRVYDLVIKFDGSITGEHNDGIIRTPFLEQMYGKEVMTLFQNTKDILDPRRIFNPHKKVDPDFKLLRAAVKTKFL